MSCAEKLFTGAVAVAVIGGCAYAAVDSINNPQTTNIRHVGAADIPQPENMPLLASRATSLTNPTEIPLISEIPTIIYRAPIVDKSALLDDRFKITDDLGNVFWIKEYNSNGCKVTHNPDNGVIEATNYGEKLVITPKPEITPIILPGQIRALRVGLSDVDDFGKQGLPTTFNHFTFDMGYEFFDNNDSPVNIRPPVINVECMTQFNGDHQEISVPIVGGVYRVDRRGATTYVTVDPVNGISAVDNVDAKRQDSDPSGFPLLVRPVEPFEDKLLEDTITVGSKECDVVRDVDGGFTMTTPKGSTIKYVLTNSNLGQTYVVGDPTLSSSSGYDSRTFGGAEVMIMTFGQTFSADCRGAGSRGDFTSATLSVPFGDRVDILVDGALSNQIVMKGSVDVFGEVFPYLVEFK